MYIKEIIFYLLWPVVIWISWTLVRFFLSMYEKSRQEMEQ
jgi:hypothetical protein